MWRIIGFGALCQRSDLIVEMLPLLKMPSLQIQKKTTDYEDKESIGFEVELANKDYTKLIDTISCESLVES